MLRAVVNEVISTVPVIAIDAMGGDYAPTEVVAGTVDALRSERGNIQAILVGREDEIRSALDAFGTIPSGLSIVHAPSTVAMDESVALSRRKRDSSLAVALNLQARGEANATVSAGNTGAAMALSLLTFGRIPGVSRPAIATTLPTSKGKTTILDAGANSVCKPENLYQFAVMGSLYHSHAFGVTNPRVGLLSIGEEATKGDSLVQATYPLLAESSLNFIGNVEGRDIFPGNVDVVVCDGFTGNVLLKFAESMPRFFASTFYEEVKSSWMSKIGAFLARNAFRRLKERLDWQEFGGAPLLGIDGVTIICHGRSERRAIESAIRVAARAVRSDLTREIKTQLEKTYVEAAS